MIIKQHRRAIGVFPSREAAGQAIDQLIFSGFPIEKVFLVGQDVATEGQFLDAEYLYALVEQAHAGSLPSSALGLKKGLVVGNAIGSLAGIFLGLGILALPAVGTVLVVPAIAFTLLSSGVCTAAGGVIGALIGLGMTEKQARAYSERIALGDSLVIVDGTFEEIHRAIEILNERGIHPSRLGI
jgi:hypothetical protein